MTAELFPTLLECAHCQMPILIHLPGQIIEDGDATYTVLDYGPDSYYLRAIRAHPCWNHL